MTHLKIDSEGLLSHKEGETTLLPLSVLETTRDAVNIALLSPENNIQEILFVLGKYLSLDHAAINDGYAYFQKSLDTLSPHEKKLLQEIDILDKDDASHLTENGKKILDFLELDINFANDLIASNDARFQSFSSLHQKIIKHTYAEIELLQAA